MLSLRFHLEDRIGYFSRAMFSLTQETVHHNLKTLKYVFNTSQSQIENDLLIKL